MIFAIEHSESAIALVSSITYQIKEGIDDSFLYFVLCFIVRWVDSTCWVTYFAIVQLIQFQEPGLSEMQFKMTSPRSVNFLT